jgi:hypothetical protein
MPASTAPQTSSPPPATSTWGRVTAAIVLLTVVLAALLIAFALPMLHLRPNMIPISVAGPRQAAQAAAARLDAARPGAFRITAVRDAAAARARILDHQDYAAIVVEPKGTSVLTASAAGPAVAQLMTSLAASISAAQHAPVPIRDVAPLPARDPAGVGVAAGALPLVLGGWISAVVIMTMVRGTGRRIACGFAFSVIGAFAIIAIEKFWFGSVAGNYFLISLAVALGIAATTWTILGLRAVLGNVGLGIGAVLIILVGNPLSGLTSAPDLLPSPWGTLGQYLPPGATGSLLRSTAFFDGHGGLPPALVLTAWLIPAVALFLLGETRARRASMPPSKIPGPATATTA